MKKCPNPNCGSDFVYADDDSKTLCPFCHSKLIVFDNAADYAGDDMGNSGNIYSGEYELAFEEKQDIKFISKRKFHRTQICEARIVEIEHQEMFRSKWMKIFSALLHAEPYQFAHQVSEYTLRVENITDDYPANVLDFHLFGNYLGRFNAGDHVIINYVDQRDRRVAKKIYNATTSSTIKPGLQIPALVIRFFFLLINLLLISFIVEMCQIFHSASLFEDKIYPALTSILIIILGIWFLISTRVYRRRRR